MEVNQMLEILKQSKEDKEFNKESRVIKFVKNFFSGGKTEDPEHERLKYIL